MEGQSVSLVISLLADLFSSCFGFFSQSMTTDITHLEYVRVERSSSPNKMMDSSEVVRNFDAA